MISDRALTRLLRSEAVVRRDGDAIRVVLAGLVMGAIVGWMLYYALLVRLMAGAFHFNDFGKFYYSARLFLDGQPMYGPNPATLMPVGNEATRSFLNMNPPHFHLPLLPLATLPLEAAALVWAVASALALGYSLFVIAGELAIKVTPTRALWALLAILTFSATGATIVTGQVTFLLLPFVTLAWQAARRGAWSRAGALLGVLISVKPFLLVFLPYFVLRRHWCAAIVSVLTVAAAYAAGLAMFGLAAHRDWLAALDATDWAWAAMNGSLLGILSRSFGESPYYTPLALLPRLIAPLWWTCAFVVGTVTLWATWRDRSSEAVDRAFVLLLVGALMISPLGWVYYLWLPIGPAAALAWRDAQLAARGDSRRHARWRGAVLWLAVPGIVWPLMLILLGQPSAWATLTIGSLYFWATLFIWGAALMDR